MKVLPERLLFSPSIEPGRPLIPEQYPTGLVMDDKSIVGSLQQRRLPTLSLLNLFTLYNGKLLSFSLQLHKLLLF
jgi:hypothetical protein